MDTIPSIAVIKEYENSMMRETVALLACAFAGNPLNLAAFGEQVVEKNLGFFRTGLPLFKGSRFVAVQDAEILGFIHWVSSPACCHSTGEKLMTLPAMLTHLGVKSAVRVSQWLRLWEDHDPEAEHIHLGPLGVDPLHHGRGIGRQLVNLYCQHLDHRNAAGYLETDKKENVAFYYRFGFEIIREVPVLGVTNYLMWREPGTQSPGQP